jgi:two-component system, NarL family, sensor histidine kinase DesK
MARPARRNDDPATGTYWSAHPWRHIGIWRFAPPGGHGPMWRAIFAGIWLTYLIPLVASAFRNEHHHGRGVLDLVGVVAIAVTFAVVYIVVVGWWDVRPRFALPGYCVLSGLAITTCLLFGGGASPMFIYVAVAGGMAINRQWLAMRAIAASVVGYVAFSLSAHMKTSDFLSALLPLLFGGLAALGFRARHELTRELMRAREKVALLAASEERLRLARDMHDLTGQSLSMITLKSELAARVLGRLPDSPERDRAREEIAEVADVSRQALHDIREAISGYRRPTLAVEAITGRAALEAAGITAHDDTALTLLSGTVDPDAEAALAWCLREAVTNVIRHSGARTCSLALRQSSGELTLEVRDDGKGVSLTTPAGGTGHCGLRGMSERLSAVGGHLEIHPGEGGFRLLATVPAGDRATVAT